MIKSTTVRNLLRNFAQIRRDLQSGITYMLVYRSVPIAKIVPIDIDDLIKQEANEKTIIKASLIDFVQNISILLFFAGFSVEDFF